MVPYAVPPASPETLALFHEALKHYRALLLFAAERIGTQRIKLGPPRDYVQSAILRACDPEDARYWSGDKREKNPNLRKYLLGVVRSLISNERKRKRLEVRYDPELHEDLVIDLAPSAPTQLIAQQEWEAFARELRALVQDPVDLAIIDLSQDWVFDVDEQARRTGASEEEVLLARKRLRYHVENMLEARKKRPNRDG